MIQKKSALIGTSCVGKTSVANEMKKIFGEERILEEGAREYFERFKPNERFTLEHQREIQDFVIHKEKKLSNKDILICDRSIICPIIYTRAGGDKNGSDFLYQRVTDWIPTYTNLLLLDPYEVPYQKDSVRDEDPEFRMKVHVEYIAFLKEKDIQYTLIKGSLNERIKRIRDLIEI